MCRDESGEIFKVLVTFRKPDEPHTDNRDLAVYILVKTCIVLNAYRNFSNY